MVTTMSELLVVGPSHGNTTVEPCRNLFHPATLVVGEHYLFVDRYDVGARLVFLDVQLVAYTACPAIVIVLDSSGEKMRILREDLYAYPGSSQYGTTFDASSSE